MEITKEEIVSKIETNNQTKIIFKINYPISFIPRRKIKEIKNKMMADRSFKITSSIIPELSQKLGISEKIIHSVRNSILVDLSCNTSNIVSNNITSYYVKYDPDFSTNKKIKYHIECFCHFYNCHPPTTYKTICKFFVQFNNFAEKYRRYQITFDDDLYVELLQDDINNPERIKNIAQNAKENEEKFIKLFADVGIEFKTEDQLKEENINNEKIVTPDIKLISDVTLNGMEIKWIEFKNQVCRGEGIIHRNNLKQIKRYVNILGPGAVFYNLGVAENVNINDVIFFGGINE
jgi:hypothetical protein